MSSRIQVRRDTAANWTAANPILAEGEFGYERSTKRHKIGDGTTAWTSLVYQAPDASGLGTAATHAATDFDVAGAANAITSISATPTRIGQLAVVGGVGYMSLGVSSSADWKQVTNTP